MAAALQTNARATANRFSTTALPNFSSGKHRKKFEAVRCSLIGSPESEGSRRRLLSISLLASQLQFLLPPNNAFAGSLLDKYVKRKKLDPLEVYVPAVILTEMQIKDLEKTLQVDKPEFASCRTLLRSGPAGSLRVNIRAVAQYASDAGNGKAAFNDVDQCLRALEDLDSLFLRASRNNPDASVKLMKAKIVDALRALDSLLNTVPPEVLDKGRAIADAYNAPEGEADTQPEIVDPELKQLESIL
ncbi:unnamed protein product [Linum tenue]|uniref:DUF7880 domain-containing protein n=1 Tax=Linum tenue TaxID=586396 RepID=A0AAV0MPW2_9ROSI|nr:unnamed protein product [Linum tenue]